MSSKGKVGDMIPELINNYNVYVNGGKTRIGVSGEVELPELEALTEEVEAAGVLGTFDAPAVGHYSSSTIKIPFAILHEDIFTLIDPAAGVDITLRGSEQFTDKETGATKHIPVRVVVRGKAKTNKFGTFAKGKKGDPEIEIEILYLQIDVNNGTKLKLDKLNFVFEVNGKDKLAAIRKNV